MSVDQFGLRHRRRVASEADKGIDPRPIRKRAMSQTETTNVDRRLAAILAADVVGYSRLMEVDEAGTLARLKTIRLELIDPAITNCKGRIIKTTGDGMLVEFQSVTEALRCAVDFQERMARRNRDMPASRTLLYRIGINLGDVIVEETTSLATASTWRRGSNRWRSRAGSAFRRPCAIRSATASRSAMRISASSTSRTSTGRFASLRSCSTTTPPATTLPHSRRAARPRPAPKPSIAVLPFVNMSGDAEQEFFADGLTEDIITELSRFRELLVISRNAVFVHKGKPSRRRRSPANSAWTMLLKAACARRQIASGSPFSSSTAKPKRISGPNATIANSRTFSPFRTR